MMTTVPILMVIGDGIVLKGVEKLDGKEVKYFMKMFRSQMQAFSQRQWSIT